MHWVCRRGTRQRFSEETDTRRLSQSFQFLSIKVSLSLIVVIRNNVEDTVCIYTACLVIYV